jgi:hypothetical protein
VKNITITTKSAILAVVGLFSLCVAAVISYAQGDSESLPQTYPVRHSQEKEIVFRHLTIDDGLSDSSVYHILQDRLGFIWATTVNAINKYDGMSFTTYMPQASVDSQNTPQFYQAMLEDRDAILWISTFGGLSRFDPTTEQFTNYRHDPDNPDSIASNNLNYLMVRMVRLPCGLARTISGKICTLRGVIGNRVLTLSKCTKEWIHSSRIECAI